MHNDNLRLAQLAGILIDRWNKRHLWHDTCIYVNGTRLIAPDMTPRPNTVEETTEHGSVYLREDDIDAADFIPDAEPNTLTVGFEGPLYATLHSDADEIAHLARLFNLFGYRMEFCDHWMFTLVKKEVFQ